jgi:glycosyltransferase involved in cell wall biosynthesis
VRRRRVCVCTVQAPFVWGGAEVLAETLLSELSRRGLEVEHIRMPLVTYPKRNVLQGALNWRLLDLGSPILPEIDLCVPLKFPAYAVRHPLKVPWLLHQFRDAYDIFDSSYYHFTNAREDVETREAVVEIDNVTLRECRHVFTISRNVSARLLRYNGVKGEPLYPPPRAPERYRPGPFGDYVLSVGRLEAIKRVDLLVRAMAQAPRSLRCHIVGEGSQRDALARLIEDLELGDRVRLLGRLDEDKLLELYSGSRAVYYAPFDEDYGYVTVEAFLCGKPVITCSDAGGPLEFVEDRKSGWIVPPEVEAVAEALAAAARGGSELPEMGRFGTDLIRDITWDRVVACLTQFLP